MDFGELKEKILDYEEVQQSMKDFAKWRKTEIGILYEKMMNSHGNAWVIDSNEHASLSRMKAAWEQAAKDQKAFLDKLTELTGIEHPYGKTK